MSESAFILYTVATTEWCCVIEYKATACKYITLRKCHLLDIATHPLYTDISNQRSLFSSDTVFLLKSRTNH